MVSWVSVKEYAITAGFFTGILFPLRLLFYHYLSSYWLGTFGLVSIITLSILYLAKKNRLGEFGNIIIRRFYKRAKGKMGLGEIAFSLFFIYFCSLMIYGSTYGNDIQVQQAKERLHHEGINNIQQLSKAPLPDMGIGDYFISLIVFLTPNQYSFTAIKLTNQLSSGWLLSFFTVDLAETIEVLGLMFYLRYTKVLEIGK